MSVASAAPRFTVDHWTTDDGLPQNSVIALTQTRDGYLWLGTLRGLVRFDAVGHATGAGPRAFPVYDDAHTPGLKSSQIVKLFEDSGGNLWIGTEDSGVFKAKDGTVIAVDLGPGSGQAHLLGICEDAMGSIWLLTASRDTGKPIKQLFRYGPHGVDMRLRDCTALAADNSGLIWIGARDPRTQQERLFAVGPIRSVSTALPVTHELAIGKLDFILASSQGGYWLLASNRVQKWRGDKLERDLGPYPWTNQLVAAACEDKQGNLIVGTYGDWLYWFDTQGGFVHLTVTNQLTHSSILSLVMDREDCLWVGTDGGGLNRVKQQGFEVIGTTTRNVRSVCNDVGGGVWIGYEKTVEHWSNSVVEQFAMPFGQVRAVLEDSQQQILAGVWDQLENRGPRLFRLANGAFAPVPPGVPWNVSVLCQDRQGNLWVGTQRGLLRWDKGTWRSFGVSDGLSNAAVVALADDLEGGLWIGTEHGGLNRLRAGQFTAYHKQDGGLPSDEISCLYLDKVGVLWVGTADGLARYQQNRWTRYTTAEGLISDSIAYLIEDAQGFLWMGSNKGLMRAPKSDLNQIALGRAKSFPCRAYGKADGLPSGECNFYSQPAACKTPDGKLWFPTIGGLAWVNPSEFHPNTNPPPVVIESVRVDGQLRSSNALRAPPPRSVVLQPGSERLEIDYTSLNLAAPDRARFQYRLENHETEWTDAGDVRVAHYTRLPPGQFTFHVKACNEDGIWNEAGATLDVTVLPPFWRTWWFLSASSLCLLGIVVATVHYVSTQKLHRQLASLRQQEAVEHERARIARDLHDQLGANLTQVALLSEMAEDDKDQPDEVEAHARQIAQTARETTRALDEIVWTVNPSNDTLDSLINYVCKYAQEYLALAGLRYRLDVPPQLPNTPISPELRHNLFLVAKEAVNNVVKHSKATSAWLRLQLEPGRFILEIEDNGRGIAPADAKKGRSGLRNMAKRMEDVGGTFEFAPGTEGGTRVRLAAPLRKGA